MADIALSPDGSRLAFSVQHTDRPGAPYTRIWTADLAAKTAAPFANGIEGSSPRWSPDGKRLAFSGRTGDGKSGIVLANADGTGIEPLADVMSSNHPLPQVGERLAWSPDGRRIAFVSATPGPEPEMEADPIVITRYWFRPASSAGGRFSDNRRLHLFVADVGDASKCGSSPNGTYSEHSIDWSPDGKQLVYLSNREPDPDFFFNYDIFVIDVDSGVERRLTTTKNNEYGPVWSPDGKAIAYQGLERPITSSETNMEDTHVWTLDVATGERRELGAAIDNRQGRPQWSPDGAWIYFTVQSRGSARLHRLPAAGGAVELVDAERADTRSRRQLRGRERWRGGVRVDDARRAGGTGLERSVGRVDTHRPQPGGARRQDDRRGRSDYLRERRRSAGRSVPDEAAEGGPERAASDDRDDPRRAAQPAGPRLQSSRPGVRGARDGRR